MVLIDLSICDAPVPTHRWPSRDRGRLNTHTCGLIIGLQRTVHEHSRLCCHVSNGDRGVRDNTVDILEMVIL